MQSIHWCSRRHPLALLLVWAVTRPLKPLPQVMEPCVHVHEHLPAPWGPGVLSTLLSLCLQLDCPLPQPRGHQHLREEPAILRTDPEAGGGLGSSPARGTAQIPQLLPVSRAGQSRDPPGAGGGCRPLPGSATSPGNSSRQQVRGACRVGVALLGCGVKLGGSDPQYWGGTEHRGVFAKGFLLISQR